MVPPARQPEDLLAAARAGSLEAIGALLEARRRYLLGIAAKHLDPTLKAKEGASDVVQETFLEAHRDFAQFRGTTDEELLGWLRRILLHNIDNLGRRFRDTTKRDMRREIGFALGSGSGPADPGFVADGPSPSEEFLEAERAEALKRALAKLPDDYREILSMRFGEDLSFEEAGRRMDRSAEAARKLWVRALDRLRQEWDGSQ